MVLLMIRYTHGNLLDAEVDALVNTVNVVGVMGKGIALMFKEAFPENFAAYEKACKAGRVKVGRMFVTRNPELVGPTWIINFPTKKHWRHPSKLEWVRDGLKDLLRVIKEKEIKSIAIPPLGAGSGGLSWNDVRKEVEAALGGLDIDVVVYEPAPNYVNAPKLFGSVPLTPARALISELIRRYSIIGSDCTLLEIQKLAWFLQRMIAKRNLPDQLRLTYEPNMYGPYSDGLRHLLEKIDGTYIRSEKRIADATPTDVVFFVDERRADVEAYLQQDEASPYKPALQETEAIIEGFQSPLGMELLATVDWLLVEEKCRPIAKDIKAALKKWPGGKSAGSRKLRLFDARLIGLALKRLTNSDNSYAA